jgi:hypothetical protein
MDPTARGRLEEIRSRSYEHHDDRGENLSPSDSDTRWLIRYVDLLRNDNAALRKRRTSFEHKVFSAMIVVVGLAMIGVIAYNIYIQPTQELFPSEACTYSTWHACAAWLWDYSEPLVKHPH